MKANLPFPTAFPHFSKDFLKESFVQCRFEKNLESSQQFSILLPENWQASILTENSSNTSLNDAPALLARCSAIEDPFGVIQITMFSLAKEISPADWLELYLHACNLEVICSRRLESPSGAVSDSLTRSESNNKTIISRFTAIKDFNRIFLIHARTLESDYPKLALPFYLGISSFNLLNPINWPFAERLKSFSRRTPGDFCLFYPESWLLEEDPTNDDTEFNVQIIHMVDEEVLGSMSLMTLAFSFDQAPEDFVQRYLKELTKYDLEFPPVVLQAAPNVGGFWETWVGRSDLKQNDTPMEIFFTIGKRPDAWFIITLLTPTKNALPDVWAINKRAYDLLLEHFRTPQEEKAA